MFKSLLRRPHRSRGTAPRAVWLRRV